MEKSSASGHGPETTAPPARDVVTVPSRQGLEAMDLLRLTTGVGPVFHDRTADSLAFLVPPGTADRWDLPGSRCQRADGDPPPACGGETPTYGSGWLVPPNTDTSVTDPTVLREALGAAARTIELVDGFEQPSLEQSLEQAPLDRAPFEQPPLEQASLEQPPLGQPPVEHPPLP